MEREEEEEEEKNESKKAKRWQERALIGCSCTGA